jgi:hypothetical protein
MNELPYQQQQISDFLCPQPDNFCADPISGKHRISLISALKLSAGDDDQKMNQ